MSVKDRSMRLWTVLALLVSVFFSLGLCAVAVTSWQAQEAGARLLRDVESTRDRMPRVAAAIEASLQDEEPGPSQTAAGLAAIVTALTAGVAVLGLVCCLRWRDRKTRQAAAISLAASGAAWIIPALIFTGGWYPWWHAGWLLVRAFGAWRWEPDGDGANEDGAAMGTMVPPAG